MSEFDDDNLTDEEFIGNAENEAAPTREISADLIRGHINTIILRTLTDGEKYGTEIIEEIERKSHGQYIMKQPTLYSALKRLESQGFVTSYWGGVSNGGRRRYFNLTSLGREEAEKNIDEWEYSRTIIDNLISSRYVNFSSDLGDDSDGEVDENYEIDDAPAIAEDTGATFSTPAREENNERVYSPLSNYFSHADEFNEEPPTDCAQVEIPVSLREKTAIDEEEAAPVAAPEEPVYDYDSSAEEGYDYSAGFMGDQPEEEEEHEEVPLPEDTERIYISVPEDRYVAASPADSDSKESDDFDDDIEVESLEDALSSNESEDDGDSYSDDGDFVNKRYGERSRFEEDSEEETEEETEEEPEEEPEEEAAPDEEVEEVSSEEYNDENYGADKEPEESDAAQENEPKKVDEPAPPSRDDRRAASVLSDFDYRKIVMQSQIDREYRKTLDRIFASAITQKKDDDEEPVYVESEARPLKEPEPYDPEAEERAKGEYKKIIEAPAIRQEAEESYKIAGYQSQELFDEHYTTVERAPMNMGEAQTSELYEESAADENIPEEPPVKRQSERQSERQAERQTDFISRSWRDERADQSEERVQEDFKPQHTEPHAAPRQTYKEQSQPTPAITIDRLPEDKSMPEQENVSFTPGLIDFSDILQQAREDGLKVSITCGARSMAPTPQTLYSKPNAKVKAALVVFVIALIEAIAVFANITYLKVNAAYPVVMFSIPLLYLLICAVGYMRRDGSKDKKLRTTRSITTAIVAFMVCVLAICAVAIASGVKLEETASILAYLVIPAVYSFNLIIYSIVFYAFAKR